MLLVITKNRNEESMIVSARCHEQFLHILLRVLDGHVYLILKLHSLSICFIRVVSRQI